MQKQAFWWISSCLPPKVCNPICPTKLLQSIWLDNSNPWSDMILFHCSEMISYHLTGIIFSQALSRWYPHIICNNMKYFTSAQGNPQSICYSNRTPWLLKLHDCRNSMKKMKENKLIKLYLLLIKYWNGLYWAGSPFDLSQASHYHLLSFQASLLPDIIVKVNLTLSGAYSLTCLAYR